MQKNINSYMDNKTPIASHGIFTFMNKEKSTSSLHRNGLVRADRDLKGDTINSSGIYVEQRQLPVYNARLSKTKKTLKQNGFELLEQKCPNINFYNEDDILLQYYPICEKTLKRFIGASNVFAVDHNIRSATGKEAKRQIKGGNQFQGPAGMVHGDYTLSSAPQRIKDFGNPPKANDTLKKLLGTTPLLTPSLVNSAFNKRFAIINIWRSISDEGPVQNFPLAFCDGQTVRPEDLVTFEIHYADRIGENYFSKFRPEQEWFFYPFMTKDEIVFIKQWDSIGQLAQSNGKKFDIQGEDCTFSFHSAFKDPNCSSTAPDRISIEVRLIAFFDDDLAELEQQQQAKL